MFIPMSAKPVDLQKHSKESTWKRGRDRSEDLLEGIPFFPPRNCGKYDGYGTTTGPNQSMVMELVAHVAYATEHTYRIYNEHMQHCFNDFIKTQSHRRI